MNNILICAGFFCIMSCGLNQQSKLEARVIPSFVDSIPSTYSPVPQSTRKTYTLQRFVEEMLHFDKIRFDSLCLVENQIYVDNTPTSKVWCATCDGTVAVWFKEDSLNDKTNILQIGNQNINLEKMLFQKTRGFMDTIGNYIYSIGCQDEYINKFILGRDTFLNFSADFFFCNGSACGQHFEFLYCFNMHKLFAFDFFRGLGYFGDANADEVIDYMEILPENAWSERDTALARFYTLNRQREAFEPLKNELGQDALIWLVSPGKDFREAKKLRIINQ